MATHHADIRLQLAFARLRALPQPSWPTVLGAVVAAALAMWWIMARQAPAIDPQSVIAANLAAAHHAVRQQRFVEPLDRSALHHFTAVLALDPTNVEARAGLDGVAEHFVERTKSAIVEGRIAEGAIALDTLRRLQPSHRRIALLDAQLRRAIDERALLYASAPQSRKSNSERSAALKPAAVKAPPIAAQAPQTQTRTPVGEAVTLASTLDPSRFVEPPTPAPAEEPAHVGGASAPMIGAPAHAHEPPAPEVDEPAPARERTLLAYVAPTYPRDAMMRGIEGWIDVQMSVTPAGDVVDPSVQGGKARQLFERAALAAVRRWKYDARPDAVAAETMTVRVSFKLQD